MHEDPQIPNYGEPDRGPRLEEGMVFAIEPMVNAGGHEVYVADDGWSISTVDGSLSAHFEHTVAVGKKKTEGADAPALGAGRRVKPAGRVWRPCIDMVVCQAAV